MLANSNGQKEPSALRKTEMTRKLLILDWDHTVTNRSLAGHFKTKPLNDYDPNKKGTITQQDIKEFLDKDSSGIKNEEQLKCILQNAFKQGIEVCIASSTIYLEVVKYMVKNHLGLTNEQAESVKVIVRNKSVRDFPKHCGKNIQILYLLKQYKADHGTLPQEVMLVDDLERNIQCLGRFDIVMEELKEREMNDLLGGIDIVVAKTAITDEELNGIEFKGVKVPEKPITKTDTSADDGYVKGVKKWIGPEHSVRKTPTTKGDTEGKVQNQNGRSKGADCIGVLAMGVLSCAVGMPGVGGIFVAIAKICKKVNKEKKKGQDISTCADVKTVLKDTFASCYQEAPNR